MRTTEEPIIRCVDDYGIFIGTAFLRASLIIPTATSMA